MTQYLSKKFRTASFLLMVLIVFLHSYNLIVNYQKGSIILSGEYFNFLLQKFISDGVCRIAVPIFFIISGYLYYININTLNIETYKSKLVKRTKTILFPFLIWSSLVVFTVWLIQKISFSNFYFYKFIIDGFDLKELADILFLHPINYQLWFLQVLYVVILINPIVYLIVKYSKGLAIVLMLISWFTINFNPYHIPFFDGLIFFTLGAFFAIHKININFRLNKKPLIALYFLWGSLIGIKTYFEIINEPLIVFYLEKVFILIGVLCFWFSIDHVIHPLNIIDKKFGIYCFSFFIFLFHEPTLVAIKKLLLHLMGIGAVSNFITYILAPAITIALAILLGKLLKRKLPQLYNLLTGFR